MKNSLCFLFTCFLIFSCQQNDQLDELELNDASTINLTNCPNLIWEDGCDRTEPQSLSCCGPTFSQEIFGFEYRADGPLYPFDGMTMTTDHLPFDIGVTIADSDCINSHITVNYGFQSHSVDLEKLVGGSWVSLTSFNFIPSPNNGNYDLPPSQRFSDVFELDAAGTYKVAIRVTSDATNTHFLSSTFDVIYEPVPHNCPWD